MLNIVMHLISWMQEILEAGLHISLAQLKIYRLQYLAFEIVSEAQPATRVKTDWAGLLFKNLDLL